MRAKKPRTTLAIIGTNPKISQGCALGYHSAAFQAATPSLLQGFSW